MMMFYGIILIGVDRSDKISQRSSESRAMATPTSYRELTVYPLHLGIEFSIALEMMILLLSVSKPIIILATASNSFL